MNNTEDTADRPIGLGGWACTGCGRRFANLRAASVAQDRGCETCHGHDVDLLSAAEIQTAEEAYGILRALGGDLARAEMESAMDRLEKQEAATASARNAALAAGVRELEPGQDPWPAGIEGGGR